MEKLKSYNTLISILLLVMFGFVTINVHLYQDQNVVCEIAEQCDGSECMEQGSEDMFNELLYLTTIDTRLIFVLITEHWDSVPSFIEAPDLWAIPKPPDNRA